MKFLILFLILFSGAVYASENSVVAVTKVINVHADIYKPPVWVATKGGATVTVLGVIRDLPDGIDWDERDLSAITQGSKAFVSAPQLDLNLGWFGRLGVAASVMRHVEYNDGVTIDKFIDVNDFYAVEEAAKKLGIFNNDFVRERPSFSSQEMMNKILDNMNVPKHPPFVGWLKEIAKRQGVDVTYPVVKYSITRPSLYMKSVVLDDPDGFKCLVNLSKLENKDPNFFQRRAEAWSEGDLASMSKFNDNAISFCSDGKIPPSISKEFGVGDYKVDMLNSWLHAIVNKIDSVGAVFTIIDMTENDDYQSYLNKLSGMGFVVRRR